MDIVMNILLFVCFLLSLGLFVYITGGFVLMYTGRAEFDNLKVQLPVWFISFICASSLFAILFL